MSTKFMAKICIKLGACVVAPSILSTQLTGGCMLVLCVCVFVLRILCCLTILCLHYLIAGTHLNTHTCLHTHTHNKHCCAVRKQLWQTTLIADRICCIIFIIFSQQCVCCSDRGQWGAEVNGGLHENCNISFSSLSLQIVVIT